jgi:hypothetical protein
MGQVLAISETLYARIEALAEMQGLSVEQLLEKWERQENELLQRRQTVLDIDQLRERLYAKYGEMPDSTELLRFDRER